MGGHSPGAVVLSLLFACGPVASRNATLSTTVTTATTTTTIGPCVCQDSWVHDEFACSSDKAGSVGPTTFRGCPSLESLSICEENPRQSWCKTTNPECIEQEGDARGDGWVFCSAGRQKPEIPKCTCAAVWLNGDGSACASSTTRKRTRGCPSVEELQICNPGYEGQPWCLTNEASCDTQIDCPDCTDPAEHQMVGFQWSYCDDATQQTELPDCECEDTWSPDGWMAECPNGPKLDKCPTLEQLLRCDKLAKKPYCKTKQKRCKQQSASNEAGIPSMINEGWAYCNPTSNKAVLPTCECRREWTHDEDKCRDEPLEFKGCPRAGSLRKCDRDVSQSYCATTYATCEMQNYEARGDGWVYCSPGSDEPELGMCECQDSWRYLEPGSHCSAVKTMMRGCPSKKTLGKCEEVAGSWCPTKDERCKEQAGEAVGQGWAFCDPDRQIGTKPPKTAKAVGLTFIFTVIFCGLVFVGFLFALRQRMLRGRRDNQAKKLLGKTYDDGD